MLTDFLFQWAFLNGRVRSQSYYTRIANTYLEFTVAQYTILIVLVRVIE